MPSRKMQQLARALGMYGFTLTSVRGKDNQKPWRVSRAGDASGEHYRFSNLDEVQKWFLDSKEEWILERFREGQKLREEAGMPLGAGIFIHIKPRE